MILLTMQSLLYFRGTQDDAKMTAVIQHNLHLILASDKTLHFNHHHPFFTSLLLYFHFSQWWWVQSYWYEFFSYHVAPIINYSRKHRTPKRWKQLCHNFHKNLIHGPHADAASASVSCAPPCFFFDKMSNSAASRFSKIYVTQKGKAASHWKNSQTPSSLHIPKRPLPFPPGVSSMFAALQVKGNPFAKLQTIFVINTILYQPNSGFLITQ